MSITQFVYHLVPERVEGEMLMPLSRLKEALPDLYQRYSAKYDGREDLMARTLPFVNVTWNDVLQMIAVHPAKIRDAMTAAGFGWRSMLFFEFNVDQIGMNGTNTVIYKHLPKEKGDFDLTEDDFDRYSPEALMRYQELPATTQAHYRDSMNTKTAPFLFLWVPHVLFSGQISVVNAKIIEVA